MEEESIILAPVVFTEEEQQFIMTMIFVHNNLEISNREVANITGVPMRTCANEED